MDDLDDYIKKSIQSLQFDPEKDKIRRAAQLARSKGFDVPDEAADDFYDLTSLESGRSHYLTDGKTVKLGTPTRSGERAIGFSQVMPFTAGPYRAKGLDPMREADNIAIGLSEFAKGDKTDPIARRLAYVGGPHSRALKQYRRTGKVPDAKLYSYLPNNNETYAGYVEKSGGYRKIDDYIKNQLSGYRPASVQDNGDLDDYIQQSIKSLGDSP